MITIHDRSDSTNKLPIGEFMDALVCHAKLESDEMVHVIRIGGVGKHIWEHESMIDHGERVFASIAELRDIASDSDESLEELLSIVDGIAFGLSDSSFLFVQATDKELECRIAKEFKNVTSLPDRSKPTC